MEEKGPISVILRVLGPVLDICRKNCHRDIGAVAHRQLCSAKEVDLAEISSRNLGIRFSHAESAKDLGVLPS
jgi:hypothetical protein